MQFNDKKEGCQKNFKFVVRCLVAQSCLILCDPMDCTIESKTKIQTWKKNFVIPRQLNSRESC